MKSMKLEDIELCWPALDDEVKVPKSRVRAGGLIQGMADMAHRRAISPLLAEDMRVGHK